MTPTPTSTGLEGREGRKQWDRQHLRDPDDTDAFRFRAFGKQLKKGSVPAVAGILTGKRPVGFQGRRARGYFRMYHSPRNLARCAKGILSPDPDEALASALAEGFSVQLDPSRYGNSPRSRSTRREPAGSSSPLKLDKLRPVPGDNDQEAFQSLRWHDRKHRSIRRFFLRLGALQIRREIIEKRGGRAVSPGPARGSQERPKRRRPRLEEGRGTDQDGRQEIPTRNAEGRTEARGQFSAEGMALPLAGLSQERLQGSRNQERINGASSRVISRWTAIQHGALT